MFLIRFAFIENKLKLYCSKEWGFLHKNLKEEDRKGAVFLIEVDWNSQSRRE